MTLTAMRSERAGEEAGRSLRSGVRDRAIRAVGVMFMAFGSFCAFRRAVETGEEVGRAFGCRVAAVPGLVQKVFNQDSGAPFLSGERRRSLNDEIYRFVFAAPDEAQIQVAVAAFAGGRIPVPVRPRWLVLGRRRRVDSPLARRGFNLPVLLWHARNHVDTRRRRSRSRSSRASSDETMLPPTSDSLARSALGISV